MSENASLGEFLGPRALTVVQCIEDSALRDRVMEALQACANGVAVVESLDIAKHELAELGTPNLSAWNSLAPEVRNLMVSVRHTAERLIDLFPVTMDLPLTADSKEFDIDAVFDQLENQPIRETREIEIDNIVENVTIDMKEEVGRAIASLASMLQEDFIAFGQRLRSPQVVADRWFLLGELHEFRSKCSQCLDAVVASILSAFSSEQLEDVLPRYSNAAMRASRLRSSIVDLSFEVNLLNGQVKTAEENEIQSIREQLVVILSKWAEEPTYQFARPHDKREIILFRIFLNSWERDKNPITFRQNLEGFSKFLEVMRSINQRQELTKHDQRYLKTAAMVLESGLGAENILPYLEMAYGRNHELDQAIRACRQGTPPPVETLARLVNETEARLHAAAF